MSLRGTLYRLARLLGDFQAIRRGRVWQRVHNRILGRFISRSVRGWWA